jgi:multidrug efflux pump subunit AcrA (membrane-fusion protein)
MIRFHPFHQIEPIEKPAAWASGPYSFLENMDETPILPGKISMGHTRRFAAISLACGIAIGLLNGGCNKREVRADARPGPQEVVVQLGKSQSRTVERSVDATGTLWGDQDVTISAKVPGRVVQIFKDVGDRVAPGEPLVQIEKTDYELEQRSKELAAHEGLAKLGLTKLPPNDFDPSQVPTVHTAQLTAANAEAKYNRGRQLHDQAQPLISDQDFADLKTSWEVAQSKFDVEMMNARALLTDARSRQVDFEIATQQLADTTLRAPVPAVPSAPNMPTTTNPAATSFGVAGRLVSIGEYVKEGTPLYRIVADDPVKLRAFIPERYSGQIKVGQKVSLRVEAYTTPFTGTLSRINPQIDPTNRTFMIEAIFANPDRKLQPGAFARAQIATHVQNDVIFVPQKAVNTFAGASSIFAVADGKAREIAVETGATDDGFVEITKGLKEPLDLVVSGAGKLATGTPVKVESGGDRK